MSLVDIDRYHTTSELMEEAAAHAARIILSRCRQVFEVYVFGSIARGEANENSDIDLILVVDDHLAHLFYEYASMEAEVDVYGGAKWARSFWANQFLGCFDPAQSVADFFAMISVCDEMDALLQRSARTRYLVGGVVDVFLLPRDWKSRLEEFQKRGNHHDPDFLQNIARDARLIARR